MYNLQESDIEGLDFQQLGSLSSTENLTKDIQVEYDKNEYPALDDMLSFIERNDNEPTNISLEELSKNGTCIKDSMTEYLNKKRISSGNQKEVLKSPLSFLVDYKRIFEQKDAAHFELGTFAHLAFLEPELFELVVVAPELNLSTKEGVVEMIKFYQKLSGKRIVRFDTDAKMQDLKKKLERYKAKSRHQFIKKEHKVIIDAMKYHYYNYGGGIIPKIMQGCITELSMYGEDQETGLKTKIRPDAINFEENIGVNAIISFKTTRAESIGKFIYDCARLKYEVSEGFYQNVSTQITGRKFNATIMIILQTVPPFQPAVLWWTPESIEVGKYKSTIALSIIAECFEKNHYPGFDAKAPAGNYGIYELDLPDWAKKEEHPTSIE